MSARREAGRARETDKRKWYLVLSGEYTYTDVILDDGTGPSYDERDILWVRASSRARAKALMVRTWRRRWERSGRDSGVAPWLRDDSPFRGMTVERGDSFTDEELPDAPNCPRAFCDICEALVLEADLRFIESEGKNFCPECLSNLNDLYSEPVR